MHLHFTKLPEVVLVLAFGKHDDVAADHELLRDCHVLDAKAILVQALGNYRLPNSSPGLVFSLNHFLGAQFHHFLETHNNNIWHGLLRNVCIVRVELLTDVEISGRHFAGTVPCEDAE